MRHIELVIQFRQPLIQIHLKVNKHNVRQGAGATGLQTKSVFPPQHIAKVHYSSSSFQMELFSNFLESFVSRMPQHAGPQTDLKLKLIFNKVHTVRLIIAVYDFSILLLPNTNVCCRREEV